MALKFTYTDQFLSGFEDDGESDVEIEFAGFDGHCVTFILEGAEYGIGLTREEALAAAHAIIAYYEGD